MRDPQLDAAIRLDLAENGPQASKDRMLAAIERAHNKGWTHEQIAGPLGLKRARVTQLLAEIRAAAA